MKIAIITFHRAYNHGAVLQCYALSKTLESLGAEAEVIDYWPQYFKKQYYMLPSIPRNSWQRKQEWKTVKKHFHYRTVLRERIKAFEAFLENQVPLSAQKYNSAEQLDTAELSYNIYITGSDQVWNNELAKFDRAFFLHFKGAKNKYSYAASFGFNDIPEKLKSQYQERLSDFVDFSVREETGTRILKDLLGRESVVNCDPTLLLDTSDWVKLSSSYNHDFKNNRYILLYYVTKADTIRKEAALLAKEKKLKVITLPTIVYQGLDSSEDKRAGFEVHDAAGPLEFLALFENAEYVLTNSFHGTVFSILYHKKFKSQISRDNGVISPNDRAASLLEILGLTDRMLENTSSVIDADIDWITVDRKLADYREKSKGYLKKIVNSCSD